jgi:O-antigen/teichoic acid export membrane protein
MTLQVFGQALTFLLHAMLAKLFSAELYGALATLLALISVGLIVGKLGQDLYLIKAIPSRVAAGDRAGLASDWANANGFVLVCTIAVALIMLLFESGTKKLGVDPASIGLAVAAIPVIALGTLRFSALSAIGRPALAQAFEACARPALLISCVFFAFWGFFSPQAEWFMWANLVAALIATACASIALSKASERSFPCAFSYGDTSGLRAGLWMLLSTATYQAITQLDILLLSAAHAKEAVAGYALASRIALSVQFALIALQWIVAPQLAALHSQGDRARMQTKLTQGAVLASAFGIAVALALGAIAPWIMHWFGPAYVEFGVRPLQVLVVGHALCAMSGMAGWLLLTTGHHRSVATTTVGIGIIALPVMLASSNYLGPAGLAVAVAASLVTMNFALAWVAWRRLDMRTWVSFRLGSRHG